MEQPYIYHSDLRDITAPSSGIVSKTLQNDSRSKIVQFWRMHPNGGPESELMNDIRQVAWLPLEKAIRKVMDLSPRGIRKHLDLNRPIYARTAAYGHFGRKPEGDLFPWERLDLVEDLTAALA